MVYSILDYGAGTDGKAPCTEAIQNAIDACSQNGGGTVCVPKGYYLCGGLVMKSNVNLHLEMGATLQVSAERADFELHDGWKDGILLYAENAENIVIDGNGTLKGNGQDTLGVWWGVDIGNRFRTRMIVMKGCKNLRIENITVLESDSWAIHTILCEDVFIRGIRLLNNPYHLNSDGIDPDSCKNVIISDCLIRTGDDCICPKSSVPGYLMENLVVTNCVMETPTTAVKIGTASVGGFRDLHFSNCTIKNSCIGLGIYMKDGSVAERITFSGMTIECLSEREGIKPVIPLYIDIEKRDPEQPNTGKVRDIIFDNIQIISSSGSLLQGMPESHLENITLRNITVRASQAVDFSFRRKQVGGHRVLPLGQDERDTRFIREPAYFSAAYIDGLILENVAVYREGDAAEARIRGLNLHEINGLNVQNIAEN